MVVGSGSAGGDGVSEKPFRIHFIEDDEKNRVLSKRLACGVPRVDDEIRLGGPDGQLFYRVTKVVWVYDEPESLWDRVNVGVVAVD